MDDLDGARKKTYQRRLGWSLVVGLAVLVTASLSVLTREQLGFLGGLTDEHFFLGLKLRINGTLGLTASEPSTLRAPGYPALVALVVGTLVDDPATLPVEAFENRSRLAVFLAQAFLLAGASLLLCLWLATRLSLRAAVSAALVFGLNPYVLTLVGLLHYSVLHLFLLIGATWAFDAALERRQPRGLLLSGALWGVVNLTRPLALLLPALTFGALAYGRGRDGTRDALKQAALLAVGMAIVMAPWTVRNFRISGRIIPVSDNAWMTLWGQTYKPVGVHPNHYTWFELYFDHLKPFGAATGSNGYDYVAHTRDVAALEATFRQEALDNLRTHPGTYLRNVLTSLWTYCVDINDVNLRVFQRAQDEAAGWRPPQDWFRVGNPQDFERSMLAPAFRWLFRGLTALAVWGAVLSFRRHDRALLAVGLVFAAALLVHGLVYMQMMYYYSKLPFVIAAAYYPIGADPGAGRLAARILVLALPMVSAGLTVWMLWL